MKKLPGLQDVNSDQQNGGLEELLTYDRANRRHVSGLTAQALDSSLYSAFGQSEVSIIYTQLNQYYVVLEVAPQYWQTPEGLKDIYLRAANSVRSSSPNGNAPRTGNMPCTAKSRKSSTTPACRKPHRIVPVGDGVVQSGARRVVERRDCSASTKCSSDWARLRPFRGFFAGTRRLISSP